MIFEDLLHLYSLCVQDIFLLDYPDSLKEKDLLEFDQDL